MGSALQQAADAIRAGCVWVLDADIARYFEHVRHDILLDLIDRNFDDQVLMAVAVILEHDNPNGTGLAQGCPLSPALSNLYLCALDHTMMAQFRTVRYSDNILLLCKSKEVASAAFSTIRDYLADIGLSLNSGKTKIARFNRVTFLGVDLSTIQESGNTDEKLSHHDIQTIPIGNFQAGSISDFS